MLVALLLIVLAGCSNDTQKADDNPKDHVLRNQIDVMHDAEAVSRSLDGKINAQNREANTIAGH